MEKQMSQIPEELKQKDLFQELASKKDKDVSADEVQNIVKEIIRFAYKNAPSEIPGDQENYCKIITETYSNDYLKTLFDTKNGVGSADYVVRAFQYARG
ncbi:MAG: TipAS antibiotic-recognition domain-containing protein [Roseburia sp.]|nr:TipAS antibiotic-recognition domain-containing protein [Roseburia sp.]